MSSHLDMIERQRSYARYLRKLSVVQRGEILEKMAPSLRQKITEMMQDAQVDQMMTWEPEVRELYLDRLWRTDPYGCLRLKTKLTARMAVVAGVMP